MVGFFGVIVVIVFTINIILERSIKDIIKHFDQKFDSLATVYKQQPAVLYDNANKKCVLVYPDSVVYVRVEGVVE